MATKDECIEKLKAFGAEFDPEAHVSTLNKLLKEKQEEQDPEEEKQEEQEPTDNYEVLAKDRLIVGVTGELVAVVEGILPCGSDKNHPYTRYKINIDGDRHLMSERLIKKLFIKEKK